MKKVRTIALSAMAALALAGCTCPACGGSGMMVVTDSGQMPYATGAAKEYTYTHTIPCVRCCGSGTGLRQFCEYMGAADAVIGTADHLDYTIHHWY